VWGWRAASLGTTAAALAVLPLVAWLLRDRPRDVGAAPYGGTAADDVEPVRTGAARTALRGLAHAARTRVFWVLAVSFTICGASTNGLVQPHFIPSAHDHGMPVTTAAGLLAVVGIFDIAGTIFSGWLTDRFDPRLLLLTYYLFRGLSLFLLPSLFAPGVHLSMVAFIVFYGLDWVATVPPTLALCRQFFGARAPVVFGWVFASHQVGSAIAAFGGGLVRDLTGSYTPAWYGAGLLCLLASALSITLRRPGTPTGFPQAPLQAAAAQAHG
jgi:predicted MFS family arabinose efflux permease